jgi:hypothetical protein
MTPTVTWPAAPSAPPPWPAWPAVPSPPAPAAPQPSATPRSAASCALQDAARQLKANYAQLTIVAMVASTQAAASADGYRHLLRFALGHLPNQRCWAVEGTGSYGAGLTEFLLGPDGPERQIARLVTEVQPPLVELPGAGPGAPAQPSGEGHHRGPPPAGPGQAARVSGKVPASFRPPAVPSVTAPGTAQPARPSAAAVCADQPGPGPAKTRSTRCAHQGLPGVSRACPHHRAPTPAARPAGVSRRSPQPHHRVTERSNQC